MRQPNRVRVDPNGHLPRSERRTTGVKTSVPGRVEISRRARIVQKPGGYFLDIVWNAVF